MTVYVPILKAKHGEFQAFGTLDPMTLGGVTPIFELCPGVDTEKTVRTAVSKATKYLPPGARVAIDAGHFEQVKPQKWLGNETIPSWVAQQLVDAGMEVMPVCPLADVAAQRHLGALASSSSQRATIRVMARRVNPTILVAELAKAAHELGLEPRRVHVLLDFSDLRDPSEVAVLTSRAAHLISATRAEQWASVIVAAGAFPKTVSDFPKGQSSAIPRLDASLWRAIAAHGHSINFGDYGVNSPEMPGTGRAPLPGLRYLHGREWLVWREAKNRPGNESFYDLCKRVVSDTAWAGHAFSWGDEQIDLSAREARGPGGATEWRAYGTSHHITSVVHRLATLGEP